MYEQVFHFNSRPFTATPYVKHYFAGDAIHKSLAQARLCVDRGSGPAIVVGATGTGKSLLLAMLEEQYKSQFNVVNLGCARLDQRRELLQSVLYELQLPFKDLSETELRFSLIDHLKPSEKCPNGILLLVDEAHTLSADLLDEIRLIINFVRDGQPRVRLVMAGSQRLEENLNDSKLESFNQRIAARCYLGNMSRDETGSYVTEHIDRAGGSGSQMFPKDSLKTIHEVSDGCPRLINQVCDQALILAATQGQDVVTVECVQEAWADVQSIPGSFTTPASESAKTATMTNDESWTVIEFGQLEDDELEPNATREMVDVDEEENDHEFATDQEFAGHSPDSEGQMDQVPAEFEAVQDSEAVESSDEPLDPVAEDESAQSQEDEVPVSEYIEDQTSELETSDQEQLNADEQLEAHAELQDDAVNAAEQADMESQLAAVFGSETENEPELNSGNSEVSDLELEHSQILDQVEAEQHRIFGNSDSDEPVSTNENAEAGDDTSAETVEVSALESVEEETITAEQEEYSEPIAEDEDSESMTSDSGSVEEVLAEGHEDDESEIADPEFQENQPRLRQPVETVDPFEESFAEEENLIDRYAPFVAHQNQSSLSLTSEDLAMLTPADELEEATSQSSAMIDQQSPSGEEHEFSGQPSLADMDEPLVYASDEAVEELAQNETEEVSAAEAEHETAGEVSSEQNIGEGDAHQDHGTELATDDVRLQAEEILKRLNESQSVSCETTTETESSSGHESITVDGLCQIEEPTDDAETSSERVPQVEIVDSEFEQQHNALDESQQILNEILEQKNALAEQRESTYTEAEETNSDHQLPSELEANGDQEMIILNRMEQEAESSSQPPESPIPFPKTPVSTGRAERMDYQKLFDQLRDATNAQQ